MSYDMSVWVRADPETAREQLRALGLVGQDQLLLERRNWAITAFVHQVEAEDIPPDVIAEFRGAVTLIELHLAPVGAPFAAYRHLRKIARGVAASAEGAVEDLQTEEVWVPPSLRMKKAIRQAIATEKKEDERATVLSFGWWFAHDRFADRDGLRALVSEMEAVLPEALTRRYGPYEPLKYRRDRDGIDHYLDLLIEDDDGVEVASTAPAQDLRISTVKPPGEEKLHREIMFRSRYIRFDVDGAVLSAPGYQAHLIHVFRTLSDFVRPFYGEVRPIRNMIRAGGECWVDDLTDQWPIPNRYWWGIPHTPAFGRVAGPPHIDLWPETRDWQTCAAGRIAVQDDWMAEAQIVGPPGPIKASAEELMASRFA